MPSSTAFSIVQEIYREHHHWLRAWLQRRLHSRCDAEDIAHDTFVRILASRDAITDVKQPRAFLTTAAKRLLIDRARRKTVEQIYLEHLSQLALEQPKHAPSPEAIAMAVEALVHLAAALEGLPAKPREAFLLHYLDQQKQAEIAQHMDVSKRMVQKYLSQALLHCRLRCVALQDYMA